MVLCRPLARAPACSPGCQEGQGCIRVAGVTISLHSPNHLAFGHGIHRSPSLLPGGFHTSRRHVGDIAATGSSMVRRGPPHLLAASSTELSPTTPRQLHHAACSLPDLHCISRQQLAQHCVQVDARVYCPAPSCTAMHSTVSWLPPSTHTCTHWIIA